MRSISLLLLLSSLSFAQTSQMRSIDPASTLTVNVYKTGLFSFAAHNHVISAPIESGTVDLSPEHPSVKLVVDARGMKVLDPEIDADKRAEIQTTMLSTKVLDTEAHPKIEFASARVEKTGNGVWKVTGDLRLHGASHSITFEVRELNQSYSGSAILKQTDFGITPISIAGGSVKVKDELKIEFAIKLR